MTSTKILIKRTETEEGYSWRIENWSEYVELLKNNHLIEANDNPCPYVVFISHETAKDSRSYLNIDKQIPLMFQLRPGSWKLIEGE
jgi:hypothetical protein